MTQTYIENFSSDQPYFVRIIYHSQSFSAGSGTGAEKSEKCLPVPVSMGHIFRKPRYYENTLRVK